MTYHGVTSHPPGWGGLKSMPPGGEGGRPLGEVGAVQGWPPTYVYKSKYGPHSEPLYMGCEVSQVGCVINERVLPAWRPTRQEPGPPPRDHIIAHTHHHIKATCATSLPTYAYN